MTVTASLGDALSQPRAIVIRNDETLYKRNRTTQKLEALGLRVMRDVSPTRGQNVDLRAFDVVILFEDGIPGALQHAIRASALEASRPYYALPHQQSGWDALRTMLQHRRSLLEEPPRGTVHVIRTPPRPAPEVEKPRLEEPPPPPPPPQPSSRETLARATTDAEAEASKRELEEARQLAQMYSDDLRRALEATGELQRALEAARGEASTLRKEREGDEKERDAAREDAANAREQLATLRSELDALRAAAFQETSTLRERLTTVTGDREAARSEASKARSEEATLRKQLATMAEERESERAAFIQGARVDDTKARNLQAEVNALRADLERLLAEKDEMARALHAKAARLEARHPALEEARTKLAVIFRALDADVLTTAEALAKLRALLGAADLTTSPARAVRKLEATAAPPTRRAAERTPTLPRVVVPGFPRRARGRAQPRTNGDEGFMIGVVLASGIRRFATVEWTRDEEEARARAHATQTLIARAHACGASDEATAIRILRAAAGSEDFAVALDIVKRLEKATKKT